MNSLFNRFNNQQPVNQPIQNDLFARFGGYQNFIQAFNNFSHQFQNASNLSPQLMIQQMLASGRMTQDQFNQLRIVANQITGKNY